MTTGYQTPLTHEFTPCVNCQAYFSVPGSLLETFHPEGFDKELLNSLPLELLHREFHLHLKVFTKEHHERTSDTAD